MMLNTAYRHGSRKYQPGFQRGVRRIPRPANAPIYLVPDTPPTRRAARSVAAKFAGKFVARLIPGVGVVLVLMDIKELTEVMRKRPNAVFLPRRDEGWDMQGGILHCSTGGFQIMNGQTLAPLGCNAGTLHLKVHDNHWHWHPTFEGGKFVINGIPDTTWSLDPLYWDSRPNKIKEIWKHSNPQSNPPPNVKFEKKRGPFLDPFGDPGPAPAPHDKPVPWPPPGETPDLWPPGWRPPVTPSPPTQNPPREPGRRRRPERPPRRHRRPENEPGGIPGREVGPAPTTRPQPHPGPGPAPRRKPTEVPLHRPTVIFTPGRPTKISPKPHLRRKPKKRSRERKVAGLIPAGSWVARGLSGATEGLDALYAVYDALPPECRESRIGKGGKSGKRGRVGISPVTIKRPPPLEAFQRIAQCLDKLDVGQALINLAMNEIEDFIIGRLAGKAGKALGEQFHRFSPGDFRARSPLAGFGLMR